MRFPHFFFLAEWREENPLESRIEVDYRKCLTYIDDLSSDSDCMFHCNYPGCTYETNRSAHLKRHERTHTKERPYKCELCDYCASRSDHLRRHYKIHSKVASSRVSSHVQHKPVSYSQPRVVCAVPVRNTVPVNHLYVPQPLDEGSRS